MKGVQSFMTAENEEIQAQAARFQQRLDRFVEVVGPAVQATRELPQLPRKQRAREAYRLLMELAEATSPFFEELFAAAQVPHLFELIDFDLLKQSAELCNLVEQEEASSPDASSL